MFVITSRTNNPIVVKVVENGKLVSKMMTEKLQTVTSEEVTEKMIQLSSVDPQIITYAEVDDNPPAAPEPETVVTKRGRKSSSEE